MRTPTISISMATYNGAGFLQEQLDSLAAQTLKPCELVVCDDGSTDETVELAEKFAAVAPFKVRIYHNQQNLGYADNFLKSASLCEGDWIAFCDQDDVWFPEKLLTISRRFYDDVLLVVHSADLTDCSLFRTGGRLPNVTKNTVKGSLQSRPWWTPAGFTQCFSAKLIREFPWQARPRDFNYPERMQAHDQWTYFLANSFGSIAYVEESLAFYRRHDDAATGNYQSSFAERFEKIRDAGAAYYAELADVASDYVGIIESLSPPDHVRSEQGEIAQNYYRRIGLYYQLRSELHSSRSYGRRVRPFLQLCRLGAYGNKDGQGLGFKALAKDLVTLL
jgi:glycosyltransferase involved in cell wall biosynthesis